VRAFFPSLRSYLTEIGLSDVAKNAGKIPYALEIGLRTRESVEVLRGLAIGDTVATTNLLRLRPGVRVEPVAAGGGAPR